MRQLLVAFASSVFYVTAASPHLFVYDLVIVMPAFIATAGILLIAPSRGLRWVIYSACLSSLAVPIAAFARVQLVTLVLAAWLVILGVTHARKAALCTPGSVDSSLL